MGVFNIGGEGQLIVGAIGASGAAIALGDGASGPVLIVAMVVAGAAAGAAWAGIAAVLRAYLGTNEIITTLMLNYLAINLATYLVFGSTSAWRELTGTGLMFPQGKKVPDAARWPGIDFGNFTVGLGFFLGTAIAIGLFVLFRATRYGFSVRVIGDEPRAARYAGMRTRRTILSLLALSGAVAGVGGASDVGGTRYLLDPKALGQAGYGYAGIVVAALARLNPLAVVGVSILMGGLANAGRALQGPDFPAGLVGTLQGLLLVCTLAGELFARYRVRRTAPAPATSGAAA
ncbi:MAG: ABC transporter permease [Acidimicrobiales bacterium]